MVNIHSVPEGEALYGDVKVYVNTVEVPVQRCRVSAIPFNCWWPGHQRPLDQTEFSGFVSMEASASGQNAQVSVQPKMSINEAWLRPLSKKVILSRGCGGGDDNCNEINFTLNEPGHYILEMNDHHNPIMFFVNPIRDDEPKETDPDVIYFGPGVHHPGIIHLKTNQTLYIAPGAVVYASVTAENQRNLRIMGGGILDNSEFPRTSGSLGTLNPVSLYCCENVEIRDVIFRDSSCFTVQGFNCRNVHIDNVKVIGNWRYNTDGIDFFNSQNIIIENCFLRTFDDTICLKAARPYDAMNVENWLVKKCVLWCDWGHALEIGAETVAEEYRNILFTDCDIIHAAAGPAIDLDNCGNADCHDIVYDNIRVEYKKSCTPDMMQETDDSVYDKAGQIYMAPIIAALIPDDYCHSYHCGDSPYGRTHHITYRNIQAIVPEGMPMPVPRILFTGCSETADTSDIIIDGYYVNGKRIDRIEDANIKTNQFVSGIRLL